MAKAEIRVDLDKKCKNCKKGGATQNGLCLDCILKKLKAGGFDHILKPIREATKQALKKEKDNESRNNL